MAITNLTNTTWVFKEKPTYGINQTFSINFTSNGESFTTLYANHYGMILIGYTGTGSVYNGGWSNQAYRTIEITGGADVENENLIAWLEANTLKAPEFTETKTALKIYADLTTEEFASLTKESNSFYQVDGVGVYKGDKLIAKNKLTYFEYTFEGDELEYYADENEESCSINLSNMFNGIWKSMLFFADIDFLDGGTVRTPILTHVIDLELTDLNCPILIATHSLGSNFLTLKNKNPEDFKLVEGSIEKIVIYASLVFEN